MSMVSDPQQALANLLLEVEDAPPLYRLSDVEFVRDPGTALYYVRAKFSYWLDTRMRSDDPQQPPVMVRANNQLHAISRYTEFIRREAQREAVEERSREMVAAIVHHQPAPVVETEDEP